MPILYRHYSRGIGCNGGRNPVPAFLELNPVAPKRSLAASDSPRKLKKQVTFPGSTISKPGSPPEVVPGNLDFKKSLPKSLDQFRKLSSNLKTSFYRQRNWGPERESVFVLVTELNGDRARLRNHIPVLPTSALSLLPHSLLYPILPSLLLISQQKRPREMFYPLIIVAVIIII